MGLVGRSSLKRSHQSVVEYLIESLLAVFFWGRHIVAAISTLLLVYMTVTIINTIIIATNANTIVRITIVATTIKFSDTGLRQCSMNSALSSSPRLPEH